MNARFGPIGAHYATVAADPHPNNPQGTPPGCETAKQYQTNAIIYRDRLQLQSWTTYQAKHLDASGHCVDNTQDRSRAIVAKFYDKKSLKTINVTSYHWPTDTVNGPPCATQNADLVDSRSRDGGTVLNIAGGDANVHRGDGSWYAEMNRWSFTDNIPAASGENPIDFLFARKSVSATATTNNGETVITGAGGHKPVRGRIYY
jgi:hypothetical protein